MVPIEKNIRVIDEEGNEYEATYPKRAKGLVKNGRARFVSENTICLACPPNPLLEDIKMSDQEQLTVDKIEFSQNQAAILPIGKKYDSSKFSIDYALEQIEKIASSAAYLDNMISELRQMKTEDGVGDIATQAKAQALADMVKSREMTNQKLLDFYMKMVDDLKPKTPDYSQEKLKALEYTLSNLVSIVSVTEDSPDVITKALDTIKQIYKENFAVTPKSNILSRLDEIASWLKSLKRDEYDEEAWNAILEAVRAQMSRNY